MAAGTASRSVRAWGRNASGQLGNGSTADSDTPVKVKLPKGIKVRQVRAGCAHTLALTTKGHVLAWGGGAFGQLGNGTTSNSDVPAKVRLPKGATVKALAAGDGHGLARTSAGLYSWGYNSSGQLGDGTTTERDTPGKVVILIRGRPLGRVTSLFAGCDHSLALFSRGALLAWGDNEDGELGNGTTTSSSRPVRVLLPAGAKVRGISAGCVDNFALTAMGHVLAWGAGDHGKLGDGSTIGSSIPVRVHLPSGWRASAVSAGPDASHAFAILRRS
jgi:alpha-tubulin suppressor-like RCC1 family protein